MSADGIDSGLADERLIGTDSVFAAETTGSRRRRPGRGQGWFRLRQFAAKPCQASRGLALDGSDRTAQHPRGFDFGQVLVEAQDQDGAHPGRQGGELAPHVQSLDVAPLPAWALWWLGEELLPGGQQPSPADGALTMALRT